MKRFVLFAGYDYYPGGGCSDIITSFETLEECNNWAKDNHSKEWANILDTQTGDIYYINHLLNDPIPVKEQFKWVN